MLGSKKYAANKKKRRIRTAIFIFNMENTIKTGRCEFLFGSISKSNFPEQFYKPAANQVQYGILSYPYSSANLPGRDRDICPAKAAHSPAV
jgi:hypothetical protein